MDCVVLFFTPEAMISTKNGKSPLLTQETIRIIL